MTMALFFALALSTAELYSSGIKPVRNIWVYLLIAYIPVSILLAPPPTVSIDGMLVLNFWSWYPYLKIVLFGLMFFAVSSHDFDGWDLEMVLKVMVWCATLTALYEVTQFFYTDQFFVKCSENDWGRIAGFIGNPTLTAPFCAMMVPLAFYLKDWPKAAICIVGAVLPDCQMAWIALLAGAVVYFAFGGRKQALIVFGVSVLVLAAFAAAWANSAQFRGTFNDHERFIQWHQIFKDWTGPIAADKGYMANNALTGRGLGSFRYVYHMQNPNIGSPNRFHQAHNDLLEFGYGVGYIGVGLFIMSIFAMFKDAYETMDRYTKALLASITILLVDSLGNFIFQIGTTAFYAVILCGLLHNSRRPYVYECG